MFWKKTFKGGVHPPSSKASTQHLPIVDMPLPSQVVLPLQQHIGAPAVACVELGDAVKVGQVIAQAGGYVSVPVHASLSGKVARIGAWPHMLSREAPAISIEGDGADVWAEGTNSPRAWEQLDAKGLLEIIHDAGMAGMGGATFPTHVKLSPPENKPINAVILNGGECEPYVTCDHRLMLEQPRQVVEGLRIIMKVLGCAQGYIGVEANKPDAIRTLRQEAADEPSIRVVALQAKYPQGAEKQLIHAILKRETPCAGGLPMDVGCLVQNVGTAAAIWQAVAESRPLIDRAVTVGGPGIREPKNVRVRLGTLVSELVAFCGGYTEGATKLIAGGPMMGIALATDQVPVMKGTSAILALEGRDAASQAPGVCISCGRCVDVCPMHLMPCTIATLIEHEQWDDGERYHVLDCFECGSCAYVCPAKRHLVQLFKHGKATITAQKRAQRAETEAGKAQ